MTAQKPQLHAQEDEDTPTVAHGGSGQHNGTQVRSKVADDANPEATAAGTEVDRPTVAHAVGTVKCSGDTFGLCPLYFVAEQVPASQRPQHCTHLTARRLLWMHGNGATD
jgi:hypothetical protein